LVEGRILAISKEQQLNLLTEKNQV